MNNIQDIAETILQGTDINTEEEFHNFFNNLKNYMLHLYSDEFHNDIPDPYDEDSDLSESSSVSESDKSLCLKIVLERSLRTEHVS